MDDSAPFALGPRVAQSLEALPPVAQPGADPLDLHRERRRLQFDAGRRSAARLLQALGAAKTAVGVGPLGSPLWPSGFTGSITHKLDVLAVAVARTAEVASLGIDIEAWVGDAVAADIEQVCLDDHEKALAAAAAFERRWFATLAFSAKEALYKCLFPSVGEFFDFSAARVVQVDERAGRLRLRLTRPLAPRWPQGHTLEGRFRASASHVFTSFELAPR
jgi:enterobactin synthetase component D